MAEDAPWYVGADCRQFDAELWFPDQPRDYAIPKAICRTCAVRQECLADALEAGDWTYGIRAAMTPSERRSYADQIGRLKLWKSQASTSVVSDSSLMASSSSSR